MIVRCLSCGNELKLMPKIKPKKFCNSRCRLYYWRKNNPVEKTVGTKKSDKWWIKYLKLKNSSNLQNSGKRVFLICGVLKFSCGIDCLCEIIKKNLKCDPFNGDVYAFCNLQRKSIRHIEWDKNGFLENRKILNTKTFNWPSKKFGDFIEISKPEFEIFLKNKIPEMLDFSAGLC